MPGWQEFLKRGAGTAGRTTMSHMASAVHTGTRFAMKRPITTFGIATAAVAGFSMMDTGGSRHTPSSVGMGSYVGRTMRGQNMPGFGPRLPRQLNTAGLSLALHYRNKS